MKYLEIYQAIIRTLDFNGVKCTYDDFECFSAIELRKAGKIFLKEEHLKGIVFSMLSSQRPWEPILRNKENIETIFGKFQFDYILGKQPQFFEEEIKKIKCGNKSIHRQMNSLHEIVRKLVEIDEAYNGIDTFIMSDTPERIATLISAKGKFKIPEMGYALALEYLRNIGIDVAKPDGQLCRMIGSDRLNISNRSIARPQEVVLFFEKLSALTGISQAKLGTTFWMVCAKDYANICAAKPKCEKCLARNLCKADIKKEDEL